MKEKIVWRRDSGTAEVPPAGPSGFPSRQMGPAQQPSPNKWPYFSWEEAASRTKGGKVENSGTDKGR